MSNEQTELEKLRTAIINEIVPIVEDAGLEPEQKFDLLLASARLSGDEGQLHKAHDAALQIEQPQAKANALLDLLDAVDGAIDMRNYEQSAQEQHQD